MYLEHRARDADGRYIHCNSQLTDKSCCFKGEDPELKQGTELCDAFLSAADRI